MSKTNKQLAHRPHVAPTTDTHRRIRSRYCWHFDAWFRLADSGALFLEIEQRIGGRVIRSRPMPHDIYRVLGNGVLASASYDELYLGDRRARRVIITELEGKARDAALTVHRVYVLDYAKRRPLGFHSESVCLHYWPVPDIPAIPEGTMNYCVKGAAVAGPIHYDAVRPLPDIFK